MTLNEFNDQFDVLYNNITSNQAPGLDEYEKSVFLTKSQDEIIRKYFDPRSNKLFEGFDSSKKRQGDFSKLIKTASPLKITNIEDINKFDPRSIVYVVPNDLLLFINESYITDKYKHTVIPISYQEYDRLMQKPYQRPPKRTVWRLITNPDYSKASQKDVIYGNVKYKFSFTNKSSKLVSVTIKGISMGASNQYVGDKVQITEDDHEIKVVMNINTEFQEPDISYYYEYKIRTNQDLQKILQVNNWPTIPLTTIEQETITIENIPFVNYAVELIPNSQEYNTGQYNIRYVRKPSPIIIEDISPLTINNISSKSECELDESIHQEILQRAVELAKAAYVGDLSSTIAIGSNSQTDVGFAGQPSQKEN